MQNLGPSDDSETRQYKFFFGSTIDQHLKQSHTSGIMQSVPRTLLFNIADMLIDVVAFLCAIATMAFRTCGGARAKCEQVKASSSQAITTIRSLDASGLCSILRDVLLFLANQLE